MAIINDNSIESLVQTWLKAEEQGEQFPVPFDDAWVIAGYKQKGHAKRKLLSKNAHLIEGEDYLTESGKWSQGGRSSDLIQLSCDAFKHFCIMAETDQGRQVRRYFIEAEKKWRLVQQHYPEVAEDIEGKRLDQMIRLEELRFKNNQLACDMATMHGKDYALAAMGKSDQIVETKNPTIEVIDERHNVRFEGQTLTQIKEFVAQKHGVKFKSGAEIKRFLERKGEGNLIAQTPRSILSDYVPKENLEIVYRLLCSGSRQLLIGE